MEEQLQKIEDAIKTMEGKDFGLYFFVLDTKGNPTAGIANIYEHVKVLNDLGYNAQILHEKNDYHGVAGCRTAGGGSGAAQPASNFKDGGVCHSGTGRGYP